MQPQRDSLIDAEEVAERIGEPVHVVYRLARQGILPAVRLGRRVKFDPQALEQFIERGGQDLPGGWRMEPDGGRS